MEIDVEHFLRIKKNLNEILANNTGKTAGEIKAASERDHWMTARRLWTSAHRQDHHQQEISTKFQN